MTLSHNSVWGGANQWAALSLASRFAVTGGFVLIAASLLIGTWIAHRIEDSVVRNSAHATALYMESFIAPISQQLATEDSLTIGAKQALQEVFTNTPLGQRVVSYKIWKKGGLIVEASDKSQIGQRFVPTDNLRAAWQGHVSADFEELTDPEDAAENALGLPLLEIYSPIREVWSGEIIAVAEFYEINQQLKSDLASATRASWITVAAAGALLGSVLYFVVLGGSRTIEQQRRALAAQLTQLRDLSAHNRDLRVRVQNAAGRAAANTEQAMRRIGADLHDGPAQYLAFAALRLDTLRDSIARDRISELDVIRGSLDSALSEVRAISRGLALPEMIDRPLCEIVQSVCEAHSLRTDVAIDISCTCTPEPEIGPAVRICVFRFVQEGLNNAWRHAGGKGVAVSLTCEDGLITVSVSDTGPGFPKMSADVPQTRIGLDALRDRVESLGGKFKRLSRPGAGAEIRMTLETGG